MHRGDPRSRRNGGNGAGQGRRCVAAGRRRHEGAAPGGGAPRPRYLVLRRGRQRHPVPGPVDGAGCDRTRGTAHAGAVPRGPGTAFVALRTALYPLRLAAPHRIATYFEPEEFLTVGNNYPRICFEVIQVRELEGAIWVYGIGDWICDAARD